MYENFLNFMAAMFLGLTVPKLILFCVVVVLLVLMAIVYKLASNHLHHVQSSIDANSSAMITASTKISEAITSFRDTTTEQHMHQIEILGRLLEKGK